jgi:hypothetical protein
MKLALIADTFPPSRSSGALQLFDLSIEIASIEHDLTVFIPTNDLDSAFRVKNILGFEVVYVRVPKFKDVGMLQRGFAEFCLSFYMIWSLRGTHYIEKKYDGVIWYSPTIFLVFFVHYLKIKCKCPTYLILRDIFPDWLVDMKLIGNGFFYRFLKLVAFYQYRIATTIGVQAFGNIKYLLGEDNFENRKATCTYHKKIEVLHNWLGDIDSKINSSIKLSDTKLGGRKIFVYTGNIGVAQNVKVFLDLAKVMQINSRVGFIFIGRGSEFLNLERQAIDQSLSNVIFFDEVPQEELTSIYMESAVGLIALDVRHQSHNIPGKFLSYMRAGLPVFAVVNPGNDLIDIVNNRCVGKATSSNSIEELHSLALDLLDEVDKKNGDISLRCKLLMDDFFSPNKAVIQILKSFSKS